jgi:hypothetical protein
MAALPVKLPCPVPSATSRDALVLLGLEWPLTVGQELLDSRAHAVERKLSVSRKLLRVAHVLVVDLVVLDRLPAAIPSASLLVHSVGVANAAEFALWVNADAEFVVRVPWSVLGRSRMQSAATVLSKDSARRESVSGSDLAM